MPELRKSPFNVANAKISVGGFFFEPGQYRVRIENVKLEPNRHGDMIYTIETTVLASDNPLRPVGSQPICQYSFRFDSTQGNIIRFIGACRGIGADRERLKAEITDEVCNESCGAKQPYKGVELNLTVWTKPTKKGTPFTMHGWSAVQG